MKKLAWGAAALALGAGFFLSRGFPAEKPGDSPQSVMLDSKVEAAAAGDPGQKTEEEKLSGISAAAAAMVARWPSQHSLRELAKNNPESMMPKALSDATIQMVELLEAAQKTEEDKAFAQEVFKTCALKSELAPSLRAECFLNFEQISGPSEGLRAQLDFAAAQLLERFERL